VEEKILAVGGNPGTKFFSGSINLGAQVVSFGPGSILLAIADV
jgi:hypothetical protein